MSFSSSHPGRVAIADVFDALIHRRRHKAALPVARADRLIGAGRGTEFDSDLTDLFLSPPVREEIAAAQAAQAARPGVRPRGAKHPNIPGRIRSAIRACLGQALSSRTAR